MIKEYFSMSLRNLMKNKLRNWLTMLGIFIGIATVVSIISLGQGMQYAIQSQLNVLGPDKIIISPKGGVYGIGSSVTLTKEDVDIVKKVKGIKKAAGMTTKPVKIEKDKQSKYVNLIGISTDDAGEFIKEMASYKIIEGRDFKQGDIYKAVLGYAYTKDKKVFPNRINLRENIKLNGVEFKVVGFLSEIGNPQDDAQLYISDDAFSILYPDSKDEVNVILANSLPGEEPKNVAARVKKDLRNFRGLKEGKEDFSVDSAETLFGVFNTVLLIVQVILIGIASISLVVGGIGIMNTMYTAVLERTKEIGVMKAIGATNRDIFMLFLVESGFLGIVGGAIGILIGMGFAELFSFIARQFIGNLIGANFSPTLIIGTLLFSFIVGSLAGTLPAMQASKLKPVEALRYE